MTEDRERLNRLYGSLRVVCYSFDEITEYSDILTKEENRRMIKLMDKFDKFTEYIGKKVSE